MTKPPSGLEAYWHHDMLDRPVLQSTITKPGFEWKSGSSYYDRCLGDLDRILENQLYNAGGLVYLGESMPAAWMSMGTHEIASYFGAEIVWADGGGDTCWAKPLVEDWREHLPLVFSQRNKMWQRMLDFYKKSYKVFRGQVIPFSVDYHSNMDLLLSLRGDENLCRDLYDCPELIDRAMEGARETFRYIWGNTTAAAKMDQTGYWFDAFGKKSTCVLACDFICMISGEMVRRWFIPTIEYEASFIDNVIFHWDGPGALRHFDDIMGIEKIHTIAFVPSPGQSHIDYIELYKKCQVHGKCVKVGGNVEQVKYMFGELNPAMTMFSVGVSDESEFRALEDWMRKRI